MHTHTEKGKLPMLYPGMWTTKAKLAFVFVVVSLAVAVTAPFFMMRGRKKSGMGVCLDQHE